MEEEREYQNKIYLVHHANMTPDALEDTHNFLEYIAGDYDATSVVLHNHDIRPAITEVTFADIDKKSLFMAEYEIIPENKYNMVGKRKSNAVFGMPHNKKPEIVGKDIADIIINQCTLPFSQN